MPDQGLREADERTRIADPFITRAQKAVLERPRKSPVGTEGPARCPHCGRLLASGQDGAGQHDVRGKYAGEEQGDLGAGRGRAPVAANAFAQKPQSYEGIRDKDPWG